MARDELSTVFELIDVRSVLTGGSAARGAWRTRSALTHPLKFFTMVSGRARLSAPGLAAPVELETGDVGVLNGRPWVELRGGPDDEEPRDLTVQDLPTVAVPNSLLETHDVFVGGQIDLNPAGKAMLMQAFPPVSHLRASLGQCAGLEATVGLIFHELVHPRIGTEFAIRQHSQLLLLEILRGCAKQPDQPPGWLLLLADERLRPALVLMHQEPGRPWGVVDLARAASMSRTSFAERFRNVAGIPPRAYLSRYRMILAQRALRCAETPIGPLAAQLGYGSESAFSNAFKRELGVSPLHYRRSARQHAAPDAG